MSSRLFCFVSASTNGVIQVSTRLNTYRLALKNNAVHLVLNALKLDFSPASRAQARVLADNYHYMFLRDASVRSCSCSHL